MGEEHIAWSFWTLVAANLWNVEGEGGARVMVRTREGKRRKRRGTGCVYGV